MSDELNATEKIVEEVLIDLMTEKVMSERGILQVYRHRPREHCQLPPPLLEQDHPNCLRKDDLSSETTSPL
jgi:hypothetical protein